MNLPAAATGVLIALIFACAFGFSFAWDYSPERLIAQVVFLLIIIMVVEPALPRFAQSPTGSALFGILYFLPRLFVLAVAFFQIGQLGPETISNAASHAGWVIAFDVGRGVFLIFIYAMMGLSAGIVIVATVWRNAYGNALLHGASELTDELAN